MQMQKPSAGYLALTNDFWNSDYQYKGNYLYPEQLLLASMHAALSKPYISKAHHLHLRPSLDSSRRTTL